MRNAIYLILVLLALQACGQNDSSNQISFSDSTEKTIETRFILPKGFKRSQISTNTYQSYLRSLPLKPPGALVHYFDGTTKNNNDIYDAVVDLKIGKRDLHQCADAVMRLRAEYLWATKQYDKIHFNLTNGFKVDYSEWMKGKRIKLKGNKTYWVQSRKASNSYQDFWKYMELVFAYAGTYSLSKELKPVSTEQMQIGDVFIQGGFPGHAITVVDMAINASNEVVFLLAQSYMPAQEIQILKNPTNKKLSPWFLINNTKQLETPEWRFLVTDLKRFVEE